MHNSKRIRRWFLLPAAAGMLMAALFCLTGCGLAERAVYGFSGEGVEHWENVAAENGITSKAEEYYYNNLPEGLHEIYREMYVHIMMNEDSGDIMSKVNADDFWKAYYAILADHPEIFWVGSSAQIKESGLTKEVVSYSFETTVPTEARASMKENLEAAADGCIMQISADATDYQKIKYVYEYLIDTVEYSSGSADSQNIQSALLYRASVCAGYSKAFQYILNRMGLFCTYVTGTIKDGGDHGWNMVRIGGNYYYVDVTWGDPVFANRMDHIDSGQTKNYNYLCCTEYDLFKTHVPSDAIPLPSCTSDDYNYYKLNGFYYEYYDYNTIYNALMQSVWNGNSSIVLKFGSQEAYDSAKYELFEGSLLDDPGAYLMQINGVTSWNYKYHTDDNFYLITIYW
ncbi:MAG: transglutaminase domain-containing protein [Candidatus Choladocola sp.]|nr:transglutaminase domain-containing protein [Candidatus Choladocola sp.]